MCSPGRVGSVNGAKTMNADYVARRRAELEAAFAAWNDPANIPLIAAARSAREAHDSACERNEPSPVRCSLWAVYIQANKALLEAGCV
jgi:hypothetical protein